MSTSLATDIKGVELDWYADNDTVHVTPRDQKRFEIQKDRAIELLQRAKQADEFDQQFDLLLDCLGGFINTRATKIDSAIVTLQDGVLTFLVVLSGKKYDEQLEDDLAELEFDIANDPDLSLITLNTLALPIVSHDSLRSFVDERLVLSYHGHRT